MTDALDVFFSCFFVVPSWLAPLHCAVAFLAARTTCTVVWRRDGQAKHVVQWSTILSPSELFPCADMTTSLGCYAALLGLLLHLCVDLILETARCAARPKWCEVT